MMECRAKEALGTLSLIDNHYNWEVPCEKPKPLMTRRAINTDRSKEKQYRITSRKSSRRQFKTLLVPKKIEFEDSSMLENISRVRINS